jgi:hypothetical protein
MTVILLGDSNLMGGLLDIEDRRGISHAGDYLPIGGHLHDHLKRLLVDPASPSGALCKGKQNSFTCRTRPLFLQIKTTKGAIGRGKEKSAEMASCPREDSSLCFPLMSLSLPHTNGPCAKSSTRADLSTFEPGYYSLFSSFPM